MLEPNIDMAITYIYSTLKNKKQKKTNHRLLHKVKEMESGPNSLSLVEHVAMCQHNMSHICCLTMQDQDHLIHEGFSSLTG